MFTYQNNKKVPRQKQHIRTTNKDQGNGNISEQKQRTKAMAMKTNDKSPPVYDYD